MGMEGKGLFLSIGGNEFAPVSEEREREIERAG
jgi:hypothetical protein